MSEKILVRAPNWLGDAVMATPFLKRLREKAPGARLDVHCRSAVAGVFQGFPGLNELLTMGKDDAGEAHRLRSRRYDAVYILPPSFSAAWLAWRAGIPRRIGYAADFRRPLLTDAFALDERYHYTRRYLGLLGEAGREVSRQDFHFPRAPEAEVEWFLQGISVPAGRKILAVAPGSRAPARRWFPERFAAVIDSLAPEWSVLLMGTAEDSPYAQAVARLTRRPTADLCGKTPLALAGALLARARALVTNESGLMHVGWAVGTPLVVLAGPSDPQATSPFGENVRVLQHREIPCVPCVRNHCYRMGEEERLCLKAITAEEAGKELADLIRPGA